MANMIDQDQQWLINSLNATLDTNQQARSFVEASLNQASLQPGPNSGYLIIQGEESETYSCFGLCKNRYLAGLPFPQNKVLTAVYDDGGGQYGHVYYNEVVLIPVLNQALSSNRYYAIQPQVPHQGGAFVCSKEEDKSTFCFCNCISDLKPRPPNPQDIYQQFEVVQYGVGRFYARSLASDGFPPKFLRRKGWKMHTKSPKHYELREAKGVNTALRARLPEFNFLLSLKTSEPVTVGKWYCPFMFVKEGKLSDQVKYSPFYEMTLEQRWERILECENEHNEGKAVSVDMAVQTEAVFLGESRKEAVWDERNITDGAIWFTSFGNNGEEARVGLSLEIIQRMKWEEERVGWIGGGETRTTKVNKEEKFEVIGGWRKFGCYILVERFSLKRMDGSSVLAYDFKHTHQIKSRFE